MQQDDIKCMKGRCKLPEILYELQMYITLLIQ